MRYSKCKAIDATVKKYLQLGWTFIKGKKHGRIKSPYGYGIVTIPSTPSDRRASLNFLRDIRTIEKCSFNVELSRIKAWGCK